jgi:hypothetical protein
VIALAVRNRAIPSAPIPTGPQLEVLLKFVDLNYPDM